MDLPASVANKRLTPTVKLFRCNTYTKLGGGSNRPEDVELFLDVGEIFVARGEGGFALEGEGGGENGKTRRQKVEWGWLGSIDAL